MGRVLESLQRRARRARWNDKRSRLNPSLEKGIYPSDESSTETHIDILWAGAGSLNESSLSTANTSLEQPSLSFSLHLSQFAPERRKSAGDTGVFSPEQSLAPGSSPGMSVASRTYVAEAGKFVFQHEGERDAAEAHAKRQAHATFLTTDPPQGVSPHDDARQNVPKIKIVEKKIVEISELGKEFFLKEFHRNEGFFIHL